MHCLSCVKGGRDSEPAFSPVGDSTIANNNSISRLQTGGKTGKSQNGVIPLTAKEKFILRQNWKGIARHATDAGANMFAKLFEQNHDLYDMFDSISTELKGTSKEEHVSNEQLQVCVVGPAALPQPTPITAFQNHGRGVMNAIDSAIKSIDDEENFFLILTTFGKQHAARPGFNADYFWKMEEPFLYAVELTLEHSYTDNMQRTYMLLIKLMLQKLVDECRREQQRLGVVPLSDSAVNAEDKTA